MFVIDQVFFILDQAININLFESRVVNKLYNFQILGLLRLLFLDRIMKIFYQLFPSQVVKLFM